jgi:hypothetical protein
VSARLWSVEAPVKVATVVSPYNGDRVEEGLGRGGGW